VYGQTVPAGVQVNFKASPAGTFSNGLDSLTVLTNASGQAAVTYQSGTTSGDMSITVTSGASASASNVMVTVGSGPAAQILLSYNSTATTPVDGISTINISALVSDAYGNTVADDSQVFFQITVNQDRGVIVPMGTTTDGLAKAALSYPAIEIGNTLTVQASAAGGTVTATIIVTLP